MNKVKVAKELVKLAKNLIALDEEGDGSGFQVYHDIENNEQERLDIAQKQGKKYILHHKEKGLWRIQACKDFISELNGYTIPKGDFGGLIESEKNLSHKDSCWVYDNAKVYGNAMVYENAQVCDKAQVYDNAKVYGKAYVCDNAVVYGNNTQIYGNAIVRDNAQVYSGAKVFGVSDTDIHDFAQVYDNAQICDSQVYDNAQVYGGALIQRATISGMAMVDYDVKGQEITE